MWVPTWELLKRMMARSVGSDTTTAAPLKGAFVGLLKDAYAPTVNSVYVGDVKTHEANYDGYGQQSITFNPPFRGQTSFELSDSTSNLNWQPTGSTTINTVTGQFMLASDSTTLLAVEMFNAPIPLPNPSTAFTTVIIFGLGSLFGYGNSLVSN